MYLFIYMFLESGYLVEFELHTFSMSTYAFSFSFLVCVCVYVLSKQFQWICIYVFALKFICAHFG